MAIDLSVLGTFLSSISSMAVIAGAIFVVFQLRQNSRLINATLHQNRSSSAFALLEKLTEESFAVRRKMMHDAVREAAARNWEGFDDSLEDFQVRNFAYIYELIGQVTREGIVDLKTITNALQYLVVVDWNAFSPLDKHLMDRYKLSVSPWGNFKWLSDEVDNRMQGREKTKLVF